MPGAEERKRQKRLLAEATEKEGLKLCERIKSQDTAVGVRWQFIPNMGTFATGKENHSSALQRLKV